ncbi:MAG: HAD family phosphatase [Chitinophagaceae bacterium]
MNEKLNSQNFKMVVFDLDNTIFQKRFIDVCAEKFHFSQALTLLRQIDNNAVSLTQRIAGFLAGRKKAELIEIAAVIPLVPDIVEVVMELKQQGCIVGIISDSYQFVTEFVAKKINADFEMANELQFTEGVATGEVLIPSYFHYSTDSLCKHQVCKTNALRHICKRYGVKPDQSIAVGDSENDACMLSKSGLGVSFCSTIEAVREVAKKHIEEASFKLLIDYAQLDCARAIN